MTSLYSKYGGTVQLRPNILQTFIARIYMYTLLCICRASERLPASQSTAPHFPSSMDGVRNRKRLKAASSVEAR